MIMRTTNIISKNVALHFAEVSRKAMKLKERLGAFSVCRIEPTYYDLAVRPWDSQIEGIRVTSSTTKIDNVPSTAK